MTEEREGLIYSPEAGCYCTPSVLEYRELSQMGLIEESSARCIFGTEKLHALVAKGLLPQAHKDSRGGIWYDRAEFYRHRAALGAAQATGDHVYNGDVGSTAPIQRSGGMVVTKGYSGENMASYMNQHDIASYIGYPRMKQLVNTRALDPVTGPDDDNNLWFDSEDVKDATGLQYINEDQLPYEDEDDEAADKSASEEDEEGDHSPEVSPELEAELVDLNDQVRRYLRRRMGKPVSKELADEHREMVIAFCHYMNRQLGIA